MQCFGKGPAGRLGFDTDVLVKDGYGDKVGLGSVYKTWAYHGSGGACEFYWKVDVPDVPGVMTAHIGGVTVDFTIAQLRRLPHKLDLIAVGDPNT